MTKHPDLFAALAAPVEIEPLRLAGRCVDGFERGAGKYFHAVPKGQIKALCGATYGRRSAGWSSHVGEQVTCPGCFQRLQALQDRLDKSGLAMLAFYNQDADPEPQP
jgi:hypothetical protein